MTPNRRIGPAAVALLLAVGCGPAPSNRSPGPEADPDRYARALGQEEAVRLSNREAEARYFGRLGRRPPEFPDHSHSLDHHPDLALTRTGDDLP